MFSDSTGWQIPPAPVPRLAIRAWRRPRLLLIGVALLTLLLLLPIIVIAGYVFVPAVNVWHHLATTVLPDYVAGSLLLAVAVGAGTLVLGTGTAWLVTLCRFPGRRRLRAAAARFPPTDAWLYGPADYAGPVGPAARHDGLGLENTGFRRSAAGRGLMLTLVLHPRLPARTLHSSNNRPASSKCARRLPP
jgi:iron(III) transport system permease protein